MSAIESGTVRCIDVSNVRQKLSLLEGETPRATPRAKPTAVRNLRIDLSARQSQVDTVHPIESPTHVMQRGNYGETSFTTEGAGEGLLTHFVLVSRPRSSKVRGFQRPLP